ncbi:zinc carboxypeptidase [Candidatus Microgenomates bacterium]|nr:zinc carboxypeptidase [Candidatus Microgenomates bacterium]
MRKKLAVFFLFLSLLLNLLTTSSLVYAEGVEIFSTLDSPPYVVNIKVEDRSELTPLIGLGLDLFEASTYDSVGALVSESEYQYLLDQGFQVQKIPGFKIAAFYDFYKTYEEIKSELQTIAANFPEITEVFSIGDSWETQQGTADRQLWALRVTNKAISAPKPKILYVGNHHAREVATPEVLVRLAHLLTDRYGEDPQITWLVDNREMVILPLLNPDGYIKVENGYSWRKNTDYNNGSCSSVSYGIDLNRNYSHHWGEGGGSTNPCSEVYQGPTYFSEPETAALRDFMTQEGFPISLSYHSFGRLLLYPWGYTSQPTSDNAVFEAVAAKLTQDNNYTAGQGQHILYGTTGDMTDWAYGVLHSLSFTFEISKGSFPDDPSGFFPTESELEDIWNDNSEPMLLAASLANDPYVHGLGPEIESITVSGLNVSVVTKSSVESVEYFIDSKGEDDTGTALSGSGITFSGEISGTGRFLIVTAKDAIGWGPPLVAFLSSITATPTPTPDSPTITPSITPSPTPGAPTVTPSVTPSPTPEVECPEQAKEGDYDCSGEVNEQDFEAWKNDYGNGQTTLSFFEYWRRVYFSSE